MNEDHKIRSETVDHVETPPRARVSDVAQDAPEAASPEANMPEANVPEATMPESVVRKRDYLAGFLKQQPADAPVGGPGGATYEAIVDALKDIFDPEIPVNIYDLGLIYGVEVSEDGHAAVTMTLTTPHCPVAESMPQEVEMRVGAVPGVGTVDVNLVWDPPWDPQKMSDEAKLELGML